MEMIEEVARGAEGGVHTLCYDRVIRPGRMEDALMARWGVQVVTKPVAREVREGETSARAWVREAVRRNAGPAATRLGRRSLTSDQEEVLIQREAGSLFLQGHLPPGISIYPRTRGFDVIDSQFWTWWEAHPGMPHRDHVAVDDQALFLLDEEGNKADLCPTESATLEITPSGTWARRTQWRVPCPEGDWVLERVWAPRDPDTARRKSEGERIVAHMDPIPRASPGFAGAYGRRSIAESVNEWVERAVPHHGRAAHLNHHVQVLDYFCATEVLDALSWQRHPQAYQPWRRLFGGLLDSAGDW